MPRAVAGLTLLLVVLVVAGCAGSSAGTTALNMAGPAAQAGGSWSGYAGVGTVSAPVKLNLTQNGGNVTGNIDVAGRPDLTGDVVGTVQGNGLTLKLQSGYGTLPVMKVTESEIVGTLSIGPMALRRAK